MSATPDHSEITFVRAADPVTSARPHRRTDMTVHELDGEALIYDPATADTHRLNATALFIWRLCDGRRDARVIAERVVGAYDVDVEAALQHVEHTLNVMWERCLFTPNLECAENDRHESL
jgi:hypothetical protein